MTNSPGCRALVDPAGKTPRTLISTHTETDTTNGSQKVDINLELAAATSQRHKTILGACLRKVASDCLMGEAGKSQGHKYIIRIC